MPYANIDKQFIQEITGYQSLAVGSYKRTCNSQYKVVSHCIFPLGVSEANFVTLRNNYLKVWGKYWS